MKETIKKIASQFNKPNETRSIVPDTDEYYADTHGYYAGQWASWDYPDDAFSKSSVIQLYKKNPILRKAVDINADEIASLQLKVMVKTGKEYKEDTDCQHPVTKILKRPNPEDNGFEFIQSLMVDLLVTGEAFPLMVRRKNMNASTPDEIIGLRLLESEQVEVMHDNYKITGYRYDGKDIEDIKDAKSGQYNLKHIKLNNPSNNIYGLSPIQAVYREIILHDMVIRHSLSILKNGGRPSLMFTIKEEKDGKRTRLGDNKLRDAKKSIKKDLAGTDNAGNIIVSDYEIDAKDLSLNAKDMDYQTSRAVCARLIASLYGVPEELIEEGNKTRANFYHAKLFLIENSVIPKAKKILADLNQMFNKDYGDEIKIEFDFNKIPVIVEKNMRMRVEASQGQGRPITTVNEDRDMLGLPRSENPEHDMLSSVSLTQPEPTQAETDGTAEEDKENDK